MFHYIEDNGKQVKEINNPKSFDPKLLRFSRSNIRLIYDNNPTKEVAIEFHKELKQWQVEWRFDNLEDKVEKDNELRLLEAICVQH